MYRLIRIISMVLGLSLLCVMATAQPGRNMKLTATGSIIDAKTAEPLFAATVKATSADGGTGTFAITDTIGQFSLDIDRPGKYTLEFSYIGYKPLIKEVNIFPNRTNLGKFRLSEDAKMLKEVETVGRSQRVKQNGDTIAFNAAAYKVQDGATADQLIAKMPGMEVTSTGVKAQGETVEKILVDGKEFFENDPKLALKTLPAEVVESVAVFDKKSDQAAFTGIDDGNTVKAMDILTKSYSRNGIFGKVYGSVGNNFDLDNMYYNAGFNLNFFNGDRRISFLGMTNNVNQQDFTFDDLQESGGMGGGFGGRMAFRRGSTGGVSRANALGIQFSNTLLDGKLDIQGSYFFNNTRTVSADSSFNDYISRTRAEISNNEGLSHSYRHRLEARITYTINENNDILFRPNINFQQSDSRSSGSQDIWEGYTLDQILNTASLRNNRGITSWSQSSSESDNESWNVGGSLLWRHKFNKAGRTLSIEGQLSRSGSNSESSSMRQGSAITALIANQGNTSDQKNWRYGGNVQYTEALGSFTQLSLRYRANVTKSENDREVDYYSDNTFKNISSIDALNSSHYETTQTQHGGEAMLRFYTQTINLNVGANFQGSILEGEQLFTYWKQEDYPNMQNPSYSTRKEYFNVLPNLRFEWNAGNGTSFNVSYNTRIQSPSLSNLQQSINTNNPLYYSTGNSDLDQSVSHNVNARFLHSNMEQATNIMFFGGFNATQDYIGTVSVINNSGSNVLLNKLYGFTDPKDAERIGNISLANGGRINRPENIGKSYSLYSGLTYGFPFDLIYSNVNIGMRANFSSNPSIQYYYIGEENHIYDIYDTQVKNISLTPTLQITSNISQDLDFEISYNPSYVRVIDEENEKNNSEYLDHVAKFRLNWTFWRGFTTEQIVNYNFTDGGALSPDRSEWVWNMSFGKKFLKGNRAEIKAQVYDVLGKATGFTRTPTDQYISMNYQNFMPRYFLLTFTYKIQNYKSSSKKSSSSNSGMGGGGAFGGGRGFGGGFGGPF